MFDKIVVGESEPVCLSILLTGEAKASFYDYVLTRPRDILLDIEEVDVALELLEKRSLLRVRRLQRQRGLLGLELLQVVGVLLPELRVEPRLALLRVVHVDDRLDNLALAQLLGFIVFLLEVQQSLQLVRDVLLACDMRLGQGIVGLFLLFVLVISFLDVASGCLFAVLNLLVCS